MAERITDTSEEALPINERSPEWFMGRFEDAYRFVEPCEGQDKISQSIGNDLAGLRPEKLTSIIMYHPSLARCELLIAKWPRAGYQQLDHNRILAQHGLVSGDPRSLSGLIFEVKQERYLIVESLSLEMITNGKVAIADMMKRYQIHTTFSVLLSTHNYVIDKGEGAKLVLGDFLSEYDKLATNASTFQFAQDHKWTNYEWLRYRITGELPPKKTTFEPSSFRRIMLLGSNDTIENIRKERDRIKDSRCGEELSLEEKTYCHDIVHFGTDLYLDGIGYQAKVELVRKCLNNLVAIYGEKVIGLVSSELLQTLGLK